jgi:hypothetical protein
MAANHFLVQPNTNEVFTWRVVNTATNQNIFRHREPAPGAWQSQQLINRGF